MIRLHDPIISLFIMVAISILCSLEENFLYQYIYMVGRDYICSDEMMRIATKGIANNYDIALDGLTHNCHIVAVV